MQATDITTEQPADITKEWASLSWPEAAERSKHALQRMLNTAQCDSEYFNALVTAIALLTTHPMAKVQEAA